MTIHSMPSRGVIAVAPPGDTTIGFNFRATQGHVLDDGPIDVFVAPSDLWRTTYTNTNGVQVDAGHLALDVAGNDKNVTDPRLRGNNAVGAPAAIAFQVEIPAGNYRLFTGVGTSDFNGDSTVICYPSLWNAGAPPGAPFINRRFVTPTAQYLNAAVGGPWDHDGWVANYNAFGVDFTVADLGANTGFTYYMEGFGGGFGLLAHIRIVEQ